MNKVEAYQCSKCKKLFHSKEKATEHESHCPADDWCNFAVTKQYGEQEYQAGYNRYTVVVDSSEEIWGSIEFDWSKTGERYTVSRFGITARVTTPDDILKKKLLDYAVPKIKELLGEGEVQQFIKTVRNWKRPTEKQED